MHLYLSSSTFSKPVPDVHLLDGHIPAIGDITPDLGSESDVFPSMEPAVWFKVLVTDSVSIDCEKKAIHWNSLVNTEELLAGESMSSSSSSDRRKRISESMYVGGDCFGYQDEFDELFDAAQKLLSHYVNPNVQKASIYKRLFALLHCYVLPNIKLTADDIGELQKALSQQEKIIEECDQEILGKYPKLEEIGNSMKRQRLTYVEELNKAPKDLTYSPALIKCLEEDICMDIKEIWGKIESQNEGIQSLKADSDPDSNSSSSGERPDNELELSLKRKERAELMKVYEHLIQARESLHALTNGGSVGANPPPGIWGKQKKKTKKFSRKKPPKTEPIHKIYIQLHEHFSDMEKEIADSTTKKVRLTSIKEAIKSTIEELKENEESFGVDLDTTGSQRPTDVIRSSRVPKRWQTMTEKVASAINKGGSVTRLFQEFVAHFQVQCQGLLSEHENAQKAVPVNYIDKDTGALNPIFYQQSGGVPVITETGYSCIPRSRPKPSDMYREAHPPNLASLAASDNHANRKSDDYLFVFDQELNYIQKGIETLEKGIKKHFEEMVSVLLGKLKMEKSFENKRRLWLCYESHFYEAVMPILVKVYNTAFSPQMRDIQDFLPSLTLQDFSINKPVFISLLVPSEVSEMPQQDSISNSSEESSDREERKEEECLDVHGLEGAVGGIDVGGSSYDETYADSSGTDACLTRVMDRLGIEAVTHEKRSHRDCSVYDDSPQDKDTDEVFVGEVPVLDKSDHSTYFSCDDELEPKDSGLSCDDLRSSKPESSEDDYRLSGDSYHPRLEILPSMIEISDSSSVVSSDSNENLRTSDISLDLLLQEAEDIVAGLEPVKRKETGARNSYHRSQSTPTEPDPVPKPMQAPDCACDDRDIMVHDPESVTVVYHRCSLPKIMHTPTDYDRSIERGQDAFDLDLVLERSTLAMNSQLHLYKALKFHPEAAAKFQSAFECLTNVITTTAPLLKLQGLMKCLKLLNEIYDNLQRAAGKRCVGACTDDLLDLLILLLSNYDPILTASLYPQLSLLDNVLAPGFENGPFSFSLMQFWSAFAIVRDKIKLKQNLAENARVQRELGSTC